MPYNGSGAFSLPAGNPVSYASTISDVVHNATMADIAAALSNALCKDGQSTPLGNLKMGGYKLTGLAAGTGTGDSLRFEQLFSQGAPIDIASEATTDIGAVNSNFLNVTGTTTITSLGTKYNGPKILRFLGALTLTHNATTLVCPGGGNITTAAGDCALLVPKSTSSGTADGWAVAAYTTAASIASVTTTTAGSAPSFTITSAYGAYAAGQRMRVKFHADGTTGSNTLNRDGLGAKNLKQYDPAGAKTSAVVVSGQLADVEYDGTDMVILDALPVALPPVLGFKNRIINGRMDIAQRGTSFAAVANTQYTLDRFAWNTVGTGVVTISQQAASAYENFLRISVTTADTSIASTDLYAPYQPIEGYNVRDLIGQPFTFSFLVRSPKTGIHCVAFANAGPDRSYVAEYTINSANTWEFKTVVVSGGLPTAGTWDWTNGVGLYVRWALAAGSTYQTTAGTWQTGNFFCTSNQVNVMDTVGNNFDVRLVQLAAGNGSDALVFDTRAYSQELELCQRYLPAFGGSASGRLPAIGNTSSPNSGFLTLVTPVPTRVPATGVQVSSLSHFAIAIDGLIAQQTPTSLAFNLMSSVNAVRLGFSAAGTPWAANQVAQLDSVSTSAILLLTGCEL